MSRPVVATHVLAYPISSMGREVAIVEIRRPTWGDLSAARQSADPSTALIARCTGLPTTDVERLDAADGAALDGIIAGFLQGPGTAPTSAP